MFGSTVLEVAVGLVFCFASVALIASTLNEAIASALRWRSGDLLAGIKNLLNDPSFDGLARDLYRHALVNPLDPGTAITESDLQSRPAYIAPRQFATALIDILQQVPGDFASLRGRINDIPNPQLKKALGHLADKAGGDVARLQAELATWFDSAMNRVARDYKRRSQLVCFLIALTLAVALNIDALHLFRSLWLHSSSVVALTYTDTAQAEQMLDEMLTLPIGWQQSGLSLADLLGMIPGWIITASAALLGAPFWFDLLQGLSRMRGGLSSGSAPRPADTGPAPKPDSPAQG